MSFSLPRSLTRPRSLSLPPLARTHTRRLDDSTSVCVGACVQGSERAIRSARGPPWRIPVTRIRAAEREAQCLAWHRSIRSARRRRRRPWRHSHTRGRHATTRTGRQTRRIHTRTRTRCHCSGHSRARHWYRQQHGARGIESGPIAVCAYGHGDGAVHLTATHHTPPLLTLYSLSRDFNNLSVSSLQFPCIGVSRMGAHDGGMYCIRLSGKIESGLHAYIREFGRDARDTREARNGDYRTVRSTVVRMPSLPPECLLVAAQASSLPPPPWSRGATSDASGRPEAAELARAPAPLVPPSPSAKLPPRSPSPLQLSAVFASVRTRCHSVRLALLDATAHERVARWSCGRDVSRSSDDSNESH